MGIAALTVIMGSLTTWLSRSFIPRCTAGTRGRGKTTTGRSADSTIRKVAARAACKASVSDSTTIHASGGASGERDSADSIDGPEELLMAMYMKAQEPSTGHSMPLMQTSPSPCGSMHVAGEKKALVV